MPAYLVARTLAITDPVRYEEYRRVAAPIVAAHGGRYLVRGANEEALEGGHQPERITIIEFADKQALDRFWNSPEYTQARTIRAAAGVLHLGSVVSA